MKKIILTSMALIWALIPSNCQTNIKPGFIGINLFAPQHVGITTYATPPNTVEDKYNLINLAGTQIVRFGGSSIEENETYASIQDYKNKVVEVMTQLGSDTKIILQVPGPRDYMELQEKSGQIFSSIKPHFLSC